MTPTASAIPKILMIDDETGDHTLASSLRLDNRAVAKVRSPEDVTIDDVEDADLVLVDYQLKHWPERDNDSGSISRKPSDGLALAAVLRRHVQSHEYPPTAFGILTGKINELAAPLTTEQCHHALARMNNLEWIFEKGANLPETRLEIQLLELANAVRDLPKDWGTEADSDNLHPLLTYLGENPNSPDSHLIMDELVMCLPPIHELASWSHGIAVVRWLLQRILPYPTFLLDSHHLAARLTIPHDELLRALDDD